MPAIKRLVTTAVLLVLLGTSAAVHAQQKFADALAMNQYLIAPNDSLYEKGQALGLAVVNGFKAKDFSGIAPAKKEILRYANVKLAELKKMKDQFGSEEFRKGIIRFLEYEINVMQHKMPLVDKLNSNSTEEEIKAAVDEMMLSSREESELLAEVAKMQSRFAARNGITIDLPETVVNE